MFNFPSFFNDDVYRTNRGSSFYDPFMRPQASQRSHPYQNINSRRPQTTRAQPQRPVVPVHEGVKCDGCRMYPIVGNKYECSVCRDFDFCEDCWQTRRHPHPFMRVAQPEAPEVPEVQQPQTQRVHPSRQKPAFPSRQRPTQEEPIKDVRTPETTARRPTQEEPIRNVRTPKTTARKPAKYEPIIDLRTPENTERSPVQQNKMSPVQAKPDFRKGTRANTVIIVDETHNKIVDILYCD